MTKEELKGIIRETLKSISHIEETDLITKSPTDWEKMKNKFKADIITLIQNIENDEYNDAKDTIGDTIAMLKFWRGKINKGLEKEKEAGEEYDFDRFSFEPKVIDETPEG